MIANAHSWESNVTTMSELPHHCLPGADLQHVKALQLRRCVAKVVQNALLLHLLLHDLPAICNHNRQRITDLQA